MSVELLFGHDDQVLEWSANLVPHVDDWGPAKAIGVIDTRKNQLIAGIVYNNYVHGQIEMSAASTSPRWCTRRILKPLFMYPFIDLGVNRCTTITPSSNKHAIKFDERIGFKHEGVLRKFFENGEDAVVMGMLKDECKWI